jgi:acyl-CoA thioesterase-1
VQKLKLHRPVIRSLCLSPLWVIFITLLAVAQPVLAEPVKIMPFGSWTEGTRKHVSYRYDLWFNLVDAGFDVDFVGTNRNAGGGVDLNKYPEYWTSFDRDHQGLASTFSDDMVGPARVASARHKPDIVLIWMGSYDIFQQGAGGVGTAKFAIRDTIEAIRSEVPGVTILLGLTHQVPVLKAADVVALNNTVTTIASEMDTPQSPVILVDQVTGFDSGSMLYDDVHHNRVGEAWVAENWFEALANILPDFEPEPFQINPGLNDAWFNLATDGQGFLISVFPDRREMFVAWFTFDTERPPENVTAFLGEPGHRWLTAQGLYDGDTANLTILVTEGGVFDAAEPAASTDLAGDGTLTLEFADCTEGLVNYEITSLDISGEIPIERITPDNVALCETLGSP